MTGRLVDCVALAARVREEAAKEVAAMVAAGKPRPGLGVILVGDDPASAVYVRLKTVAAEEAGLYSRQLNLPATARQDEVMAAVDDLNRDPRIHAMLLQSPLPSGLDFAAAVRTVDPVKDADCLHPINVGLLAMGTPRVLPCTPAGVMEVLRSEQVPLSGAEAVIIGRSNIVGRPVAQLLLMADATVTICHSRTRDLAAVTRRADILVAAVGRPEMVTADMVKPGAVVIDVGVNRAAPAAPGGKDRLVGDVDRASVIEVASLLTPVPRGIGPMTIAMLLRNTVLAARAAGA